MGKHKSLLWIVPSMGYTTLRFQRLVNKTINRYPICLRALILTDQIYWRTQLEGSNDKLKHMESYGHRISTKKSGPCLAPLLITNYKQWDTIGKTWLLAKIIQYIWDLVWRTPCHLIVTLQKSDQSFLMCLLSGNSTSWQLCPLYSTKSL